MASVYVIVEMHDLDIVRLEVILNEDDAHTYFNRIAARIGSQEFSDEELQEIASGAMRFVGDDCASVVMFKRDIVCKIYRIYQN
jgi:hypothetical protein